MLPWRQIWLKRIALALSGLSLSHPCHAQIASGGDTTLFRSDAAGVRIEPAFEPKSLPIGPLLADIKLTAQAVYQSNVLRTDSGPVGDVLFSLTPSIRLSGGFGAHSAALSARANIRRYGKLARENSETLDVTYLGRIDLGPTSRATWRTQFSRDIETRGSSGANILTAGPAELQILQSTFAAGTEFGNLGISAAGGVIQRRYMPLVQLSGGTVDQSFRDTRTFLVAPRASFAVANIASVFIGGSATANRSINRSLGSVRDSNGYALLGGIRSDTRGLVVGEIGIGWRGQNYRNPAFLDYRGFTYDATVDWYPTQLVSVRIQAGQDIVNSGIPQVAGIVRRDVGLTAYYDPLRRLRFSLELGQQHDRYREIGLTTDTATITLTGRYQFGRHLVLSSFGRYETRDSSNNASLNGLVSYAIGVALTGSL